MKIFFPAALSAALLICAACSSFQPTKERITVDLRGRVFEIGSAEAQFDKYFAAAGMNKIEITATYYPDDDVVCLRFRHNLTNYYQFWSSNNRGSFVEALTAYKQAYELRDLPEKNMKTKRAYGTVRGYLLWESTKLSMKGTSHPNIDIGYQFAKKMPYFTLAMSDAPNETATTKESMGKNSAVTMRFTRSQADTLAALFDPDYLLNASAGPASGTYPDIDTDN